MLFFSAGPELFFVVFVALCFERVDCSRIDCCGHRATEHGQAPRLFPRGLCGPPFGLNE